MPKQRLYLDESGDHTTKGFKASQWDKRYLCLFGCSFDVEMCHKSFGPQFEDFKFRYFGGDQDDPVILHREDVKAKRGRFGVLADTDMCMKFNKELLQVVSRAPFRAFAVVIDKLSTAGKDFGPISAHPYHVGLLTLLERYCGWLKMGNWTGDVLAESRGGREDEQLKAAYISVHTGGTKFHNKEFFQKRLSSKEIKIKPKSQNINPLQLADLLAYPAKRRILWDFNRGPEPTGFTADLAEGYRKKIQPTIRKRSGNRLWKDYDYLKMKRPRLLPWLLTLATVGHPPPASSSRIYWIISIVNLNSILASTTSPVFSSGKVTTCIPQRLRRLREGTEIPRCGRDDTDYR